jgi:TorA maturation chaperone TorD
VRGVARFRQAVYRYLGLVFLYPTEARCRALAESARVLAPQAVEVFPFSRSWRRLLRWAAELPEAALLQEAYVRLFVLGGEDVACAPYESYHRDSPVPTERLCAELEAEYARAGVVPSAGVPPDHLSAELEYMAFLCAREAGAWEQVREGEALGVMRREWSVLHGHLARWVPEFTAELLERAAPAVYRAAAAACEAWVEQDHGLLPFLWEVAEADRAELLGLPGSSSRR